MTGQIWTIGHSNHDVQEFFSMLVEARCNVLLDVRSKPYSRFCPQFNQQALKQACQHMGMTYRWIGRDLGGLSQDNPRMGPTLDNLAVHVTKNPQERIAMMCAERAPKDCHRHYWLGNYLTMSTKIEVIDILADRGPVPTIPQSYKEDLPPWLAYLPWRVTGQGFRLPYRLDVLGYASEESARSVIESNCGSLSSRVAYHLDEAVAQRMMAKPRGKPVATPVQPSFL